MCCEDFGVENKYYMVDVEYTLKFGNALMERLSVEL